MKKEMISEFQRIQEKSEKYLLATYNRYPVSFVYGVGELLYDQDNREYIDFQSGIAVTNLGHGEADIIEALRFQADRLFHTSNLFYSEEQAKLAEAIIENSFPGKVFLCNSGTEANEAAFKLMRKYAIDKNINKPTIVALEGSFHGRTISSMTLTGNSSIKTGFGDLLADVIHIPPNAEEALIQVFDQHGETMAGIIMEPIIGEGGIIPLTQSFVSLARKLTEETKSLLVFDEIQTGMGRTGKMFCFEHFGFSPDALTLAKALGSGFPIGALVVDEKYVSVLSKGSHGSTFGGNHLACAVAYETFRVILSRNLLENVELISLQMFSRMSQWRSLGLPVQEVRGRGLHIGLELTIPSRPIAERCLAKGLVINATANTILRIMPPLPISPERAMEGLDILETILRESK